MILLRPVAARASRRECMVTSEPLLPKRTIRSEEHTSELQSLRHLVCRLLLGKMRSFAVYFQKPALGLAEPGPIVQGRQIMALVLGCRIAARLQQPRQLKILFLSIRRTPQHHLLPVRDALPV